MQRSRANLWLRVGLAALAAAHGCAIAVMTTLPGSKSMQNALRAGFALLYSRNVLRREVG